MTEYLLILVSTILANNFVLVQFLGLCPFMGVSGKLETAMGMSLATTFVLSLASVCSYLAYTYLLEPLDLAFLKTITFILVIAVVVQFTEMVVRKTSPLLYRVLGIFLPLITTNCAVLGVALLNLNKNNNFVESVLYGFGAAAGFSLVLVLFAAMRERIAVADVPVAFRGAAIGMVTAGLMSLAFLGFTGLVSGCRSVCIMGASILIAVLVLLALAVVFGGLLGFAAERFRVEGNPLVDQIDSMLPQTQCGQCGFPGCRPYAESIANGDAINKCPPGGETTIKALADLLDVEPQPLDAEHGVEQAKRVAVIREDECIGCTKCIQACPVDAILGAAKHMHTVIESECTGCDLCVEPCPVDCIDMITVEPDIRSWTWTPPKSGVIATDRQGANA